MILESTPEVTTHVQQKWVGKPVAVTKTEPTPDIRFTIKDARVVGPEEVNEAIRKRYPKKDARFLVLLGEEEPVHSVIIHVDDDTVYDVRDGRLVILTNEEVVQLSRLH